MRRPDALTDGAPPALDDRARRGLVDLYEELDRRLAALADRGAHCRACGRCCRFADWGHEVWLTGLELAYLVESAGARSPTEPATCPYLDARGRCAAREGRTVSCRVFFCELPAEAAESLYAEASARLDELHRRSGVERRYGELLASLARSDARGRGGDH